MPRSRGGAKCARAQGAAVLNYRHAFHAGNFADVHKHGVLLGVLAGRTRTRGPLTVIDTHAGAGLYALDGEAARRSGEAADGVLRLIGDAGAPPALAPLVQAVRRLNPGEGPPALYPGSPLLALGALRGGDRYIGCELRPDDHAELRHALAARAPPTGTLAEARLEDGYAAAARLGPAVAGRLLLLIDPPYERGDDPARIAETLARVAEARGGQGPPALVWAPIKDLESYDALLRRLEALPYVEGWAAEARLRPPTDPMRLNGAALIGLGVPPPAGLGAITAWAASAGEAGALGRVTPLFG